MTREMNIATQEKAAQHLNAGKIDATVDPLFAPDYVDHDPAPGQGPVVRGFGGSTDELGIMQQLAAAPDAARKGVFGTMAEAFTS